MIWLMWREIVKIHNKFEILIKNEILKFSNRSFEEKKIKNFWSYNLKVVNIFKLFIMNFTLYN